MNRSFLRIKFFTIIALLISGIVILSFTNKANKTGTLKITFVNTANGKPLVLNDSVYTNAFGEQYTISKLKYYISHVSIPESGQLPENDSYHLINAAAENNSFDITLHAGAYKKIQFLLGVDSEHNCNGAQTGALDPMNDMFWTWSTGYVIFKLEGTSASSAADLKRIEHHIGGYKGANNVSTVINLNFPGELTVKENAVSELVIETNLDHYWKYDEEIKISETPMWMTMGGMAKRIALNFRGLFSVMNIK